MSPAGRNAALAALALLAAAIGASGCGGDDADQFRSEANDACRSAVTRISAISADGPLRPGSRSLADFAGQMEAEIDSLRTGLDDVNPPDDLADAFDAFDGHLAEQQREWDQLTQLTAPLARDRANLRMTREMASTRDAQELGLDDCVAAGQAIALGG